MVLMIGGVVTAAIVALGGVLVAIVNRGGGKTTPSPPAPTQGRSDHELYERTAVHNRRLDDADERHHQLDVIVDKQHDVLDDHGDRLEQHDHRIARLERQMRIHDETGRD